MKFCILLITIFSLGGGAVQAQTEGSGQPKQYACFMGIGVQMPYFKKLNNLMTANGYSEFSNTQFGANIGISRTAGRKFSAIEFFSYRQQKSNQGGYQSAIRLSGSNFSFGYSFPLMKNKLDLIQEFSFVMSEISIKTSVGPNAVGVYFPGHIIAGIGQETKGVNAGAGLRTSLLIRPSKTFPSFFMGVRASYHYTKSFDWKTGAAPTIWKKSANQASDVPRFEAMGATISLMVGVKIRPKE